MTTLDATTTLFSLSVLTATKGNASKRLIPAWVDNCPIKDPTHTLGISTGCVEHAQVAGLAGLRDLLQRITPKQALVHGVPKGSNPGDVLQLVLADKYSGAPGTIARTLACIDYPPGVRLMMCDYDPALEAPETMASAGELVARLTGIWPACADAGWLATTSTSSAIRDKQTHAWLTPPEGMHVYLLVTGNVTRFREHARVRLWLAGTGYCKLATPNKDTGVASILERCLIDLTVLSPERLDYVAGALIPQGAPFYQDRPTPELHPGLVLDLDSLPEVTDDERAAYVQLVAEARARVAPEQRAKLRAHITSAAPTLPDTEVEQEITTRLARADRGELDASHPLYFDHGAGCTAGTLSKALDGTRLRDPLEPDYGPSQAVFHWNTGGTSWRIVSWAHGVKKVYRLAQPASEPRLPDDGDMDDLLSRVGDAEDSDGLAAGARQDDDARGLAVRYRATRHGLIWSKPTREGPTDVHLSNFTATISAEITEDDGVETRLRFTLTAQLQGKTHRFEIPAAQFAGMRWVTEHLGATAIVMPGMTLKDHTRAAIQILSRDIVHRRVYTHIGWCTLGDQWCYLHAGGAIDTHGTVHDIAVAPGQALTAYQLPSPPLGDDARVATRASLALLDVAPDSVTLPPYAALWRAVLGEVDFSLHLSGLTGQGKTALAALIQQHWGAGMDARRLPASWSSTGNALEGLAFAAKDAVLVVDDFSPTGAKADIQRSHRDADRLLRAQGNNSGRQRMRADSTLRPAKPPRGLILSTGEDIPRGQSLRARVLIIDVAPGIMQWDKLTTCQDDADKGVYAQTLAGFVHWLAPRYGEVMQGLPAELRALRQQVLQGGHRRTPDIVANLALGMQYFLAYAHDGGALTLDECRTYWERTWRALGDVATAQSEHHAGEEPVRRFFALLSAALTAGLAHMADASTRTDPPAIPEHWGWRVYKQRIGEDPKSEDPKIVYQPLGACIGWLHGDRLYLDPEAAFSVVQRLADTQQAPLPITQQTLWKRMHEQGVLRRETGQQKIRYDVPSEANGSTLSISPLSMS
jgi:hypothetical protein